MRSNDSMAASCSTMCLYGCALILCFYKRMHCSSAQKLPISCASYTQDSKPRISLQSHQRRCSVVHTNAPSINTLHPSTCCMILAACCSSLPTKSLMHYPGAMLTANCNLALGCAAKPTNSAALLMQVTVHNGYPAVPPQVTASGIKESYNPARPNAGGSRREMPAHVVSAVLQEV